MTSSVGQAVSKVNEAPPPHAVTQAFSSKQKAEDVDRKIRFYGVIQAFREGRYPDNKQIDETLKATLKNSPVDLKELSPDGRKLVEDFRAIIETARQMVMEKNSNEEFQNFLFAARKSDPASQTSVKSPVGKEEAKKDAETAGQALETLVKLFLRNGEFRKLINDAGLIGRDVFADAAVKASDMARPDEEAMANVDQPAPHGEFHDDIPEALKPKSKEQKEADQRLKEAEKQAAAERAKSAVNGVDPNDPTSAESKDNVAAKAKEQREALLAKIPAEHKERVKEHKDKTINYAKEKFPEERRDQFIYRLKKVVVECQSHRDWQDSISFLLTAFENYKGHAENLHDQTLQASKDIRGEGAAANAETLFRQLIEKFANGRPTQPILTAVDDIYTDVKNDPELRDWFKRLDSYLRKILLEPGYVMKDESDAEGRQIRDSGKKFFTSTETRDSGKYKPHADRLWDEITTFTQGFAEDPLNKKFGQQWQNLFEDLIKDDNGTPKFKSHLLQDTLQVILPQLLTHISYIPLPRIEFSDPTVDLVVENIAAAPINLLPNVVEIETNNYVKASVFKNIDNRHKHSFRLTLGQIHLEMRDVYFQIKTKSGFKTAQYGYADILLGGKGMTVTAEIEGGNAAGKARSRNVFTVKTVKAVIDNLDFSVHGSKHDGAIKALRPLAKSIAKKQIAKAAEAGIRDGLEQLNKQLTAARNAAYNAEKGKKGDAIKDQFKKDEKASTSKKQGEFKIPTSMSESILPKFGTKDGWIRKLDQQNELAKNSGGSAKPDWHSPAFSIV